MPRLSSARLKAVALVLATVLAASWSPAAAAPARQALSAATGNVLQEIWSLWASFWSPAAAVDNGCHLDPDGSGCATLAVDNGCHLDPNGGGCATQAVDNGCHLDPSGFCRSGSE